MRPPPPQRRPKFQQIHDRLRLSIARHGGTLPERVAIIWDGYLAALLEWHLISVDDHKRLTDLIPPVPDHPVFDLFLEVAEDNGRPDGPH